MDDSKKDPKDERIDDMLYRLPIKAPWSRGLSRPPLNYEHEFREFVKELNFQTPKTPTPPPENIAPKVSKNTDPEPVPQPVPPVEGLLSRMFKSPSTEPIEPPPLPREISQQVSPDVAHKTVVKIVGMLRSPVVRITGSPEKPIIEITAELSEPAVELQPAQTWGPSEAAPVSAPVPPRLLPSRAPRSWSRWGVRAVVSVLLVSCIAWLFQSGLGKTTPLPYSHTAGPVVMNGHVIVVDWFRSNLYTHRAAKGLPLISVESIPNEFITGLAIASDRFWTIDGYNHKILEHALTTDHRVLASYSTPGEKPRGLFWDGKNLWLGDDEAKKVYRLGSSDLNQVEATYGLRADVLSAFCVFKNELWVLDRKSHLLSRTALEGSAASAPPFDLTPFLNGATPSGFCLADGKLYVLTENPSRLLRLPQPL